ncbi:hypothetical protein [Salipaludibacillus daqingensis]|uniref:hypothetical protein n=1 Tax=Salipaludibacillus daqingensis TaxID=3041001 RepID=UPI002475F773|nr:hypothetical protein [Salipaludibacillus daqingensis]
MVIQANMSPKGIVEVWEVTESIFMKYQIPLSHEMIQELVDDKKIDGLLQELNAAVGSSDLTCMEGG